MNIFQLPITRFSAYLRNMQQTVVMAESGSRLDIPGDPEGERRGVLSNATVDRASLLTALSQTGANAK